MQRTNGGGCMETDLPGAVEMEGVSAGYGKKCVLHEAGLLVQSGELVVVRGPNGGGKTTLLKVILGLIRPVSGSVRVFGKAPSISRQLIGYVAQHPEQPRMPVSVMDSVVAGRYGLPSWRWHGPSAFDLNRAEAAIEAVQISHLSRRSVTELSGGQRQKVRLAAALAREPRLLLLDEPTVHLDSLAEADFLQHLLRLHRKTGCTVVLISHHDLSGTEAEHRVIEVRDGRVSG